MLIGVSVLLAACSSDGEPVIATEAADPAPTVEPTAIPDPTAVPEPTALPEPTAIPAQTVVPKPSTPPNPTEIPDSATTLDRADLPLPERVGPRTQTTGTVPHVQLDVEAVAAVNDELFRRAYTLPGVEDRPTIVSLPGARGMWLSEGVALAHPEAIVNGREFAHIHPDGSLHAPLPYERALEAAEKGWAERHPWADERDGWEGFVMLFTPQNEDELDVIFQLIVESYNYVTGEALLASDFQ